MPVRSCFGEWDAQVCVPISEVVGARTVTQLFPYTTFNGAPAAGCVSGDTITEAKEYIGAPLPSVQRLGS